MKGRVLLQPNGLDWARLLDVEATLGAEIAAAEEAARIPAPSAGGALATSYAPPPTLVRGTAARALVPGQFGPAAEKAAQAFELLLETVLATAPEEFAIRQLGRALARTVRQVNVFEQCVAVDPARAPVHVRRTLDEREREEAVRLRRIAAQTRR